MLFRLEILLVFLGALAVRESGSLESSLSRCCNLGVRWAWENKTCDGYPGPVARIAPEHQAPCLSTIDACCRRNYRERQCILGLDTAKAGRECTVESGQGGHYHQDCCEGCKLGLVAGSMGLNCEFQALRLALGPPWDTSLTKCCLQAGGSGRYSRPTSTEPTGFDDNRRNEEEPADDLCAAFPGQLCSQICTSEGKSYRCSCHQGYTLLADRKTCTDGDAVREDEEASGDCPIGFQFNDETQVCDDVNECESSEAARVCYPYKTCRNTIGSFLCEQTPREDERNFQCPPGYRYNEESANCADIDECAEGYDICIREIQFCINTPGGFDCQSKKELKVFNCPAGYKFNNGSMSCEDVDECYEEIHSCDSSAEVCRNTAGAYECDVMCKDGFRFDIRIRSCLDVDECLEGTHDCLIDKESCINVPGSYQCHQLSQSSDNTCPPGYEPNRNFTFLCVDTDECGTRAHTCSQSETCVNEVGGYRCEGGLDSGEDFPITDNSIIDKPDSTNLRTRDDTRDEDRGRGNELERGRSCSNGFRWRNPDGCIDIDECLEGRACETSQICQNTVGSFYCHCRPGFYRDPSTRSCLDINECQTGQHNCLASQRCDNSPGSYSCVRITGCGTGYTLNSQTGQCEDNDECIFGNHDCHRLGPEYQCKNTVGSFRCEKVQRTCPQGLTLAPTGECRPTCPSGYQFNARGECLDIDECRQDTGRQVCPSNQNCVNLQGSYQCMAKIICPAGFEPDPSGSKCSDIDECGRGTHTCKGNQLCINRGGGYICECPAGYSLVSSGNCEDVDECSRFSGGVCGSNADCFNTPGSYRCICKSGFTQGTDNRTCSDVDECTTITGLCEQNCINTWGSFKCSCGSGLSLNIDGRTCKDIDECEQSKEGYLCIGSCVNTHGSYKCECPDGYSLGPDGRVCNDINECSDGSACRAEEQCLNTRGGYRCNRITCPYGYQRERDQQECKKTMTCNERDTQCLKQPLTISRNFISVTSNYRIPSEGYIDIFTMRGPGWPATIMHFNLEIKTNRANGGGSTVTRNHFLLRRPTQHQAIVALAKPITGPQDVELELTMEVYHRGAFSGSAVAQIVIVVTSYEY